MIPTDEQMAALDLFREGETMVIDAGAGTGKTSTLMLLAADTNARGQYLAFNKAIVNDVERKLPETCKARTAHSLAYGVVGKHFRGRLNGSRMRSDQVARSLGLRGLSIRYGGQEKSLAAGYLASTVMRGLQRFCQTADEAPTPSNFAYIDGIDLPDDQGKRTWANNDRLREYLFPYLEAAWRDVQNVDGFLPYGHHVYLKAWQLRDPKIPADYIMFDEAQDASPVMAAIVAAQTHAQCVYVGDRNQAIYGWNGAIDAMEGFAADRRTALTQSFRFGGLIAFEANLVLAQLGSELKVRGLDSIDDMVDKIDGYPDAILCRTNASTIANMLDALEDEYPFHLVGGGDDLVAFARAAQALQEGRRTSHYELACFDSWGEVVDYVDKDPDGVELKLLVSLITKFGADRIIDAVDEAVPEGPGVVSLTTAHKCSPPDEPVLTTAGWKPIGDLTDDDRLAGYVRGNNRLTWGARGRQGFAATRSSRPYSGPLIVMETNSSRTRVTPEHRVLAAFGEAFWDRWAVYLMRRGDWWRVGMCRTGSRPYRSGDLGTRMSAEGADAGWLLSLHDSRPEAASEEARVQAVYGVTGLMFNRRRGLLSAAAMHAVHDASAADVAPRAKALLDAYGLLEGAPLYQAKKGAVRQGMFLTAAANLPALSGAVEIPVVPVPFTDGQTHRRGGWSPDRCVARVSTEQYDGPVIGIDLPPHHYYVSGGAVVHNSKGREWDRVRLDSTMGEFGDSDDELRLRYVAMTRARRALDLTDFEEGLARAEERARR